MAEANGPQAASPTPEDDALALLEEAEAEAAEAEALAAAARARVKAARLRRQALRAAADASDDTSDDEALEDDAFDDDGYDDEDLPAWRRRLPSPSAVGKVLAVLLICAFAAASGLMLVHHRDTVQRQQRAAKFVAGAKQGIVNMTSMDFNNAKEDVQRMLDTSTGQFRDDFASRAEDFTKTVQQSKVVTQGTINAAALESMDDHSARVLVSVTSHVTNAAGAKNEQRPWRFRVTVAEDGGQYKMSKVEFVP
jgi:Mce-associated membrane protein